MTFQESPSDPDIDFVQSEAIPIIRHQDMLLWELREKAAELLQEVDSAEKTIHASVVLGRLNDRELQALEKFKGEYKPVIQQLRKEVTSLTPTFSDIHAYYDVGLKYLGRLDIIVVRLSIH